MKPRFNKTRHHDYSAGTRDTNTAVCRWACVHRTLTAHFRSGDIVRVIVTI